MLSFSLIASTVDELEGFSLRLNKIFLISSIKGVSSGFILLESLLKIERNVSFSKLVKRGCSSSSLKENIILMR